MSMERERKEKLTDLERAEAAEEIAWMLWQKLTCGMDASTYRKEIRDVRSMFRTCEAALAFNNMLMAIAGEL